jgi:hypothetical protein
VLFVSHGGKTQDCIGLNLMGSIGAEAQLVPFSPSTQQISPATQSQFITLQKVSRSFN